MNTSGQNQLGKVVDLRAQTAIMDGGGNGDMRGRRCPRCDICGKVVRVRGLDADGVLCAGCVGDALPFVGLIGEGEYRGALREYQEGLGSRAAEFQGLRLDPYGDEMRGALGGAGAALGGCAYTGGDGLGVA